MCRVGAIMSEYRKKPKSDKPLIYKAPGLGTFEKTSKPMGKLADEQIDLVSMKL